MTTVLSASAATASAATLALSMCARFLSHATTSVSSAGGGGGAAACRALAVAASAARRALASGAPAYAAGGGLSPGLPCLGAAAGDEQVLLDVRAQLPGVLSRRVPSSWLEIM